ncbi:hypothetical protein AB205_0098760 [Aquarana catesbeiana]|uniref:Uncharacterized protein n=1 Tax=Aquarana catesbeiana TaxID=8400 RepID=A0A2G9SFD7_AQUCT|nr:hypothetical protein AB205_0098760 [Aquarana catesbeiana]
MYSTHIETCGLHCPPSGKVIKSQKLSKWVRRKHSHPGEQISFGFPSLS